jgi:hypothetical protein
VPKLCQAIFSPVLSCPLAPNWLQGKLCINNYLPKLILAALA